MQGEGFCAVCPDVADQSNMGAEVSTAFRALENFLGSHGNNITLALHVKQLAFFLKKKKKKKKKKKRALE